MLESRRSSRVAADKHQQHRWPLRRMRVQDEREPPRSAVPHLWLRPFFPLVTAARLHKLNIKNIAGELSVMLLSTHVQQSCPSTRWLWPAGSGRYTRLSVHELEPADKDSLWPIATLPKTLVLGSAHVAKSLAPPCQGDQKLIPLRRRCVSRRP